MDKHLALENLRRGLPPVNPLALEAMTVTLRHDITTFWLSSYLEDFIAAGGSKVKFLLGKPGSGKTHALLLLQHKARLMNYIDVFIDARSVRLHQFNTIYQAVMEAVDIENLVSAYSAGLVEKLGYQAEAENILQHHIPTVKEVFGQFLRDNLFLYNLSSFDVRRLLHAISEYHSIAYNRQAPADIEAVPNLPAGDTPLRTTIRSMVEYLDLQYLYGEEPTIHAGRPEEPAVSIKWTENNGEDQNC